MVIRQKLKLDCRARKLRDAIALKANNRYSVALRAPYAMTVRFKRIARIHEQVSYRIQRHVGCSTPLRSARNDRRRNGQVRITKQVYGTLVILEPIGDRISFLRLYHFAFGSFHSGRIREHNPPHKKGFPYYRGSPKNSAKLYKHSIIIP